MTAQLPQNLLNLFYPRPPLRYLPPTDHDPAKRHTMPITGLASVLEQAKEVDAKYKELETPPTESAIEKRARIKAENSEKSEYMRTDGLKDCKLTDS
jgi:U1 small nuclear ribonucleoprotein 70kDa